MSKNYKTFYQSFGLANFPFNTFTTEDEVSIAKDIFVSQGEYDPIIDAFKTGRNIILQGERGVGKTAILEDFKRYCEKDKIITIIHDFSSISTTPSSREIYNLLISSYLTDLFVNLGRNSYKILRLSKEEKVLLSYLLARFIPATSQNTVRDKITKIQVPLYRRVGLRIYNIFRKPLNYAGTVAANATYSLLVRQFAFLPYIKDDTQVYSIFPELKLKTDETFLDQEISFGLLKRIGELSSKLGFSKPTLLLDRLDEDQRFQNDADAISEFIKPFLTDTNLLSIAEVQIIFFVWATPLRFIEESVRTQKYYCPSLKWSNGDLTKLVNKRLEFYSEGSISNYRSLFDGNVSDELIEEIFLLANSNPRDLIHIFRKLFEEQYTINPESKISNLAIERALPKFVTDFNYYEYYPRRTNARANSMEIYSYAAHLLKLESPEFSKNQLNDRAGTGSSTNNYVISMERIGLIENVRQEKGNAVFRIKDQKIVYAQKKKLELKK